MQVPPPNVTPEAQTSLVASAEIPETAQSETGGENCVQAVPSKCSRSGNSNGSSKSLPPAQMSVGEMAVIDRRKTWSVAGNCGLENICQSVPLKCSTIADGF